MKKIGRFISYLYLHMELGFIIKAYIYAVVFTVFMCFSVRITFGWIIYYIIASAVFPFGYLAVNDLLAVMPFSGLFMVSFVELSIINIVMLLLKFVLFLLVWMFWFISAPAGIIYILLADSFASWAER